MTVLLSASGDTARATSGGTESVWNEAHRKLGGQLDAGAHRVAVLVPSLCARPVLSQERGRGVWVGQHCAHRMQQSDCGCTAVAAPDAPPVTRG